MEEILEYIKTEMESIGVPYEFLEWTQPVSYPYFVGEYGEAEPITESGEFHKTFTLTGFCRGRNARLKLEQIRTKMEQNFDPINGKIAMLTSGSVIAIFYSNALPIPSGEAELYKIVINLDIKKWKVN